MPQAGRNVVLVDGARTPFGKAGPKGLYAETRADDLVVRVLRELLRRNPNLPPERIDEVEVAVVHFDDGHVRITADLPKKVDWDQKRLAEITQRIAANGDDPSEYVEISYRISETKFNAWPESLKSAFAPARTLKTGKPGFRLALLQE